MDVLLYFIGLDIGCRIRTHEYDVRTVFSLDIPKKLQYALLAIPDAAALPKLADFHTGTVHLKVYMSNHELNLRRTVPDEIVSNNGIRGGSIASMEHMQFLRDI